MPQTTALMQGWVYPAADHAAELRGAAQQLRAVISEALPALLALQRERASLVEQILRFRCLAPGEGWMRVPQLVAEEAQLRQRGAMFNRAVEESTTALARRILAIGGGEDGRAAFPRIGTVVPAASVRSLRNSADQVQSFWAEIGAIGGAVIGGALAGGIGGGGLGLEIGGGAGTLVEPGGGTIAGAGLGAAIGAIAGVAVGAVGAGIAENMRLFNEAQGDVGAPSSSRNDSASSAKTGRDIRERLKKLPRGSRDSIRLVPDESALDNEYAEITKGARPANWKGHEKAVELDDGTKIGMREKSKSGGKTIDIEFPGADKHSKIHIGEPK
ncbi:hypothetical protein OSC27_11500 [Microbacterium sp. STN6]|uniref:hypothetical protein n=1 Tax=Microbacterium sp. STN6 TaxID=2995588 RepID=UPI002261009A|nr:hypothetical protein [Microbacterium sp. STN6]MCX7522899.1 hypothetical protein [Microbacterium sp. STN6]